jgi:hypothetical protein
MQSVDAAGAGSAYEARIGRVVAVAGSIEERLAKRLELLDGYARVMNMIEIEVEMDMQVRFLNLLLYGLHQVQVDMVGDACTAAASMCRFLQQSVRSACTVFV